MSGIGFYRNEYFSRFPTLWRFGGWRVNHCASVITNYLSTENATLNQPIHLTGYVSCVFHLAS